MLRIVIPVFGRAASFAEALPQIIARVGTSADIVAVVDGDPATSWHAVTTNAATATANGARVITLGSHLGNGAAFGRGCEGAAGQVIKVDADVIPSQDYGAALLNLAADGPPTVGCYVGLPRPEIPRHDAGMRRIPGGRIVPLRIALFTSVALVAIGDHATTALLGGHDILVANRLSAAGFMRVYTHLAWVDRHIDTRDTDYDTWAAPYRQARQRSIVCS